MNKKEKKRIYKCVKNILSILAAILGLGSIIFFINMEWNKIEVSQNNGVIIGENRGVVKNYTMGGGSTSTKERARDSNDFAADYIHSYIDMDKSLIENDELSLEGVLINSYSYQMKTVSFETVFGTDLFTIEFGPDSPNGYGFKISSQGYGYQLWVDSTVSATGLIDEFDNIQEGAMIQITPYDFDSDGVNELIMCVSNGVDGICTVFSYTRVDNIEKINPFLQELSIPMQEKIILDGNSLQVLVGSFGIIDKEYKYVDEHFMSTTW